jgi:hypothetical protein
VEFPCHAAEHEAEAFFTTYIYGIATGDLLCQLRAEIQYFRFLYLHHQRIILDDKSRETVTKEAYFHL